MSGTPTLRPGGDALRTWVWIGVLAAVACAGCGPTRAGSDAPYSMTPAQAAAIEDSVRAFALAVARDVTREGPAAWRRHFEESAAFFMAAEGRLVFPTSDSATRVIQDLASTIKHIELRWDERLRVDPLVPGLAILAAPYHEIRVDTAGRRVDESGFFTGLAEHQSGGWRFRNAHW